MTWAEIGRTTVPQARLLLEQHAHSDGHVESARAICDTFLAVAEAAGLIRRGPSASPAPPPSPALAETDVLVPELEAVIEARVQARLAERDPAQE